MATALRPARPASRSVLEITPDLFCLQLPIVNVYLFGEPGAADREWVLIDAGLAPCKSRIERAAAECFGAASRPAAIILTHGHFDHVGALPELADEWDAPIYAHPMEIPYLTGQACYPPPDPSVGGGLMSLLSFLYPRGPIDLGNRVHPLPGDESVPGMPGWRWIFTPGHSPGHISLFRESDRTLVVGDAFVTTRQESAIGAVLQPQHVSRPPAYYTPDWIAARQSVEKLALLRAHVAATGHGKPMYGQLMQNQLDELVRNWDELALPPRGRYVPRRAKTGRQDHSLRAAASPQQLALLGGIASGLLCCGLMLRGRPRR